MASSKGPGLYEFLIEAELQQYYAGFKNDLKIQNVPQLKYVTEDDLLSIGMSKPEMRRLKKFFQRHFPQNYLSKFKKLILSKKEESHELSLPVANEIPEKPTIKVPNKHIIPAEAIVVNKELGQGEFGTVQQGVWTDEDERIQVAIKCLSRERMQNNPIEFLKEAAIMHGIDHEHIVRLYGVVLDTNSLMLVTELAPLRSLLECLKEPSLRPNFPVLSLCDFAIQVCDGMQYLEQKRLIHRDLAARNILVFSKNKVKISDFGLSRALGVGKDYYQTNFNVNLKLPIAWCAPECISYLRFTSASDVWAYGVTLWEMFSYGFQPWAALTGHQILEAIDEPNFQRLEQPECCPREYYNIMMKCWQHDPNVRPRFSDLITMLPECKPEQVQAVQEFFEDSTKSRRDQLVYKVGDVITVLDKQLQTSCWKGVTNSGKTGWFNPAHTVTYLGNNLPTNNVIFSRSDGKNIYSSKRKIRPDMISGPQGDLKHTGHVGLDGAYFGDLSFLGGKNPNLPRQIVTPYKPHEDTVCVVTDSNNTEIGRNCTDVSDCTPLLKTQQAESVWAEANKASTDHEYHEISDDEELNGSPIFKSNGPSLMDEMEFVLRSLGSSPIPPLPTERKKPPPPFSLPLGSSVSTPPASPLAEAINVKNELKEMAAKAARRRKQATVKPISAADEKTLDSAIAMANELSTKSMNDLDGCTPPESPHTPASPSTRKFSFKFPSVQKHNSPKPERKNFAERTACIQDIQALCDKLRLRTLSPTPTPPPSPRPFVVSFKGSCTSLSRDSSPQSSPHHRSSVGNFRSAFDSNTSKNYLDSSRNGLRKKHFEKYSHVKLPPWDQASAEFFFAQSRDLLTKVIPQVPNLKNSDFEVKNVGTWRDQGSQVFENWQGTDVHPEKLSGFCRKFTNNSNHKTKKTNANPSVIHKKEVPFNNENNPHLLNNVTLRKCGSKGHLRRRSYNDRYPSTTSSDSSDSFNFSETDKQMNHRSKMRKQRRGGSFSNHATRFKSQFLLTSPPPQNSFLNSITSPKITCNKNNIQFASLKPLKPEQVRHGSLNNLYKPNSFFLPNFETKWPERACDLSSLAFMSSNSSSLNWEEYVELDRDFWSCSNYPPSPAPQSTISVEAKEVYSSLVDHRAEEAQIILPTSSLQATTNISHHQPSRQISPTLATLSQPADCSESNPLRMLRSGAFPIVRPKGKNSKIEKLGKVSSTASPAANLVEEESSQVNEEESWRKESNLSKVPARKDSTTSSHSQSLEDENPIPLPPRDRSKPSVSNKPRHQRKHPLIIPGQMKFDSITDKHEDVFHLTPAPASASVSSVKPSSLPLPQSSHQPVSAIPNEVDDSFDQQIATELDALDDISTDLSHNEETSELNEDLSCGKGVHSCKVEGHFSEHFFNRRFKRRDEDIFQTSASIQPKPNLHLKQKIAQLNQTAALYSKEGTEDIFFMHKTSRESNEDELSEGETMRRYGDHVSCEDLLEFSAKSQSKSRGQDSDEVRLMSKVLGTEMTTENCLTALNATDWDVYNAIKLAKLQKILNNSGNFHSVSSCWDALTACDGDVAKAASILITQSSPPDYV